MEGGNKADGQESKKTKINLRNPDNEDVECHAHVFEYDYRTRLA